MRSELNLPLEPGVIRARAEQELRNEARRAAIDAEKARILRNRNRSPWQRPLAWLPFIITIHRRKP